MTKVRSFKDVVQQAFFDEIENRVSLYVERNFADMEFKSFTVEKVDEAHVQDADLHHSCEIYKLDASVGLDYVHKRTGIRMDGFWGTGTRDANRIMKPIQTLLEFIEKGAVSFSKRPKLSNFECPSCFQEEYEHFQDAFGERQYAKATITSNNQILHRFLDCIHKQGVDDSRKINRQHITAFLELFEKCKPKYVTTVIYVLRNYLSFLFYEGFVGDDISKTLPRMRIMRNAFIPYSWEKTDVWKLLQAVDRADPKGKRDYAILLLVVHLGLRVSDIRLLTLSSLHWNRKVIRLNMKKTKRPIELPILDDIGWAIIDYLKNGRPKTNSDRVFVRHRAPFDAFGENNCFQRELHRYMIKAGLDIPVDVHSGMHSLRNTLARNMLETNAKLEVISEALGHQNINTTSIYLKIDVVGLQKCALDPEGVMQ